MRTKIGEDGITNRIDSPVDDLHVSNAMYRYKQGRACDASAQPIPQVKTRVLPITSAPEALHSISSLLHGIQSWCLTAARTT